jgi:hypothetical protein
LYSSEAFTDLVIALIQVGCSICPKGEIGVEVPEKKTLTTDDYIYRKVANLYLSI